MNLGAGKGGKKDNCVDKKFRKEGEVKEFWKRA